MKKKHFFYSAVIVAFMCYSCNSGPGEPTSDQDAIAKSAAPVIVNPNNNNCEIKLTRDSTGASHQDTLKINCKECYLASDTVTVMVVSGSVNIKDTTFISNVILKK